MGPSFSRSKDAWLKKSDNVSELQRNLASWVMFFGALTENWNPSGTDMAHLSQVGFL
jgi:hypothetical protein